MLYIITINQSYITVIVPVENQRKSRYVPRAAGQQMLGQKIMDEKLQIIHQKYGKISMYLTVQKLTRMWHDVCV